MTEFSYIWDGSVMVPVPRHMPYAQKHFAVGARFTLAEIEQRDKRSHDHYFTTVREAFETLPEDARWKSDDDFRKWALIECGYIDRTIELTLSASAAALIVGELMRGKEEYWHVSYDEVTGKFIGHTALSQKIRAMGARQFYLSKRDTLVRMSQVLGCDVTELNRRADLKEVA